MAKRRKKKPRLRGKRSKSRKPLSLKALVAKVTPENRYAEIQVGFEIGKEKVDW